MSWETKKALFYHAKPHLHGFHCEAWRGKTKRFWSPGTLWPPCDKGECSTPVKGLVLCSLTQDKFHAKIQLGITSEIE